MDQKEIFIYEYVYLHIMKYSVFILLVALLAAGVAVSGCLDGEEVIYDTTVTIDDGRQMVYDLAPGTYWIYIVSDEKLDITFDTASTYDQKGITVYDRVITLGSTARMNVENPSLLGLGLGKTADVKVTVVKNPSDR